MAVRTFSTKKKASRPRDLAHRLKCVKLVLKGKSASEVAHASGDSFGIVARWVRLYNEHGIEGLRPKPRPGRTRRLTETETAALRRFVKKHKERVSGPVAASFLREHFGHEISPRQAQRILGDL